MDKKEIAYNYEVINNLMQSPSFASLSEKNIAELVRHSVIKEFSKDAMIVCEGSRDAWIYYLLSGKVKIEKQGRELMILQDQGSIFGEMASIDGAVRSASVYALEDTMCLMIDISNIDQLSRDNQMEVKYVFYKECAEAMAVRLRVTTDELMKTKEELLKAQGELARLKEG